MASIRTAAFLFALGVAACGGATEDDTGQSSTSGGSGGASGGGGAAGQAGAGAKNSAGKGGAGQAGAGGQGDAGQGDAGQGDAGQGDAGAGAGGAGSGGAGGAGSGAGAAAGGAGSGGAAQGGAGAGAMSGGGQGGSAPAIVGTCADARPEGAPAAPAPKPYSGGACPKLVPGSNQMNTGGGDRTFLLVVPADYDGKESLPVIFLWHWLGGDANGFLEKGQVQQAVDQLRFAAVIPEAKKDSLNVFKWPYSIIATPQQVDDELRFFDDMLGCVSEQYVINNECVASMGVSAGALWTDQLAGLRGDYLSSIVSLSGGVGGAQIKPWIKPDHKMPAYVLWGGPQDVCVTVQFQQTSQNLQQALTEGGHFQVECVHNCTHAEPPLDPIEGFSKYTPVWRFFLDHPRWLAPGASLWNQTGLPSGSPSWCGIGVGSATPRTGMCPEKSSCPL